MLVILEVLKKYSDEQHRLSQMEIGELAEKEYDMKIGRKAIKRNLEKLTSVNLNFTGTSNIK